ncbi:hypothetical protein BDR03DRAFT_1007829 [Suillus americanus]|nr:hypothetical protein BDR03DRAFT_1007829 [Suillus americanus]
MVNHSTANDAASLAEFTSTCSDLSSSPQSIVDNVAKRVKLVLPQVKATPSELHSASLEDDEADLNALKKTWCLAVYSFF